CPFSRSQTPPPVTPRFDAQRALGTGPVPEAAWQEDEDEATHALGERAPVTARGANTSATPPTIPPMGFDAGTVPYGSTEFQFENETTAVIAPDRAKELLQAESLREASAAKKPAARLDFIFDDEATEV